MKPGLCPSPEEIDSQVLSSDCENDASCPGTKKCCKANTGAMLCQKAGSTTGELATRSHVGFLLISCGLLHCVVR